MKDIIMQLAFDVLSILIPALAALTVEYIRRRLGTEKLKRIQEELATKQELAALAVRFAQQCWASSPGPERYQKAAEWLASRATERGLKVTPDEVKGLIEAALRMAKDQFGEEWGKVDRSGEIQTAGTGKSRASEGSGAA